MFVSWGVHLQSIKCIMVLYSQGIPMKFTCLVTIPMLWTQAKDSDSYCDTLTSYPRDKLVVRYSPVVTLQRNSPLFWRLAPFKADQGNKKKNMHQKTKTALLLDLKANHLLTTNLHINISIWNKPSIPIALKYWATTSGCFTVLLQWVSQFISSLNNWLENHRNWTYFRLKSISYSSEQLKIVISK